MEQDRKQKRGLAALSPEKRKAIASAGGKSVPKAKRAFSINRELAAVAGRKSKKPTPPEKKSVRSQPLFAPDLPENFNDLLILRLRVSKADFVVLQRKIDFDLERGLREAWFAMKACQVRPPVRWTLEVRDGSGALMMVLRNKL